MLKMLTDEEESDSKKVSFGITVVVLDKETKEELTCTIKGATEANSLEGTISNESPLGKALIGAKKGQTVEVNCPAGVIKYKISQLLQTKKFIYGTIPEKRCRELKMAENNQNQNNNQKGNAPAEQDIGQLLKVRREKLANSAGSGQGSLCDYEIQSDPSFHRCKGGI